MVLIEEFKEKVLDSQGSFVITEPGKDCARICYFVQGIVGKARYVYGCYGYRNINFYSGMDVAPELIAIVLDNKIYIYNGSFFNVWHYRTKGIPLPEDILMFTDIVGSANSYVRDVAFPKFYSNHKICDSTEINLDHCLAAARMAVFSGGDSYGVPEYHDMFKEQDIADMMCGFMDFNKEVTKRLKEEKNQWTRSKIINIKIQELTENPEIVMSWEKAIADGLRSVNAKLVTAEFELYGKKSAAKICPDTIIKKMVDDDYFDYYNFSTDKRGRELLKELGAGSSLWSENLLTCKDISKIEYRGKILYSRDE